VLVVAAAVGSELTICAEQIEVDGARHLDDDDLDVREPVA
jgi:hypothetical protein